MKILVLSLLRLGDLLMQKPLLEGLKRRYPGATVHVVVNPGALVACEVMDDVDQWIVFDREGLQKRVGTAEIPLMSPVREVDAFMNRLSTHGYDLLFNFTHNRLSAHLAEGIVATEKYGLLAQGRRFRTLDGRWIRHLNDRFGWKGATPFHYAELLAGAFGLETRPKKAAARGDRILLQPLTSDSKKNWSIENWKKLLNTLRANHPSARVNVLGAPFEAETLKKHFEDEDLLIGRLGEVRRLLEESALVVTGDTSIQHLAANDGVPVLSLALGSAEPRLTGPFQENAMALVGAVACSPCPPSSVCRKLSHECGEALAVETVSRTVTACLAGVIPRNTPGVTTLAARRISHEWVFTGTDDTTAFIEAFDKHLWRAFLGGDKTAITSAGARFLDRARLDGFDPSAALEQIEREQKTLRTMFESTVSTLRDSAGLCVAGHFDPAAIQGLRRHLASLAPAIPRLRAHTQDLSDAGQLPFAQPLAFFGFVRRAAEELGERLEARERWLNLIRETGGRNERLARDVSERGPEAP